MGSVQLPQQVMTPYDARLVDVAALIVLDACLIRQMILASDSPQVDAGSVDSAGLTVLHRVVEALDLGYLDLLLKERHKSQGALLRGEPLRRKTWVDCCDILTLY